MRPSFLDNMSYEMAEVYGAVTDRILVNLARYFPYVKPGEELPGSFEYQARMLAQMGRVNRETADIILQSLGGADAALRGALETAILEALKSEEPALRNAAEQGLLGSFMPPEVAPGQMQAFKSYYAQIADKLNLVNTVMLESTESAYRATVADITARIQRTQNILNTAAGEVVTGVTSWNQAVRDGVRRMVENGLTGFVDHGGHRWSPEAYVAMDVRTTMFNTARAAVAERAEQYGADLYQVSSHNGARPLCYPWQGKVISRSDWTGEVEDLDGNKVHVYAQSETSYGEPAGLFGINCKHYPMTFIPGFSTLKGEPQDPEENEKSYEESQQQRALERRLRDEKRDLEVMKAQGADTEAIKAQREKVRKASADIDQFCEDTGRARRRNREYAPVNAKWPKTETYDAMQFPTEQRGRINDWFANGGNGNPSQSSMQAVMDSTPPQGGARVGTETDINTPTMSEEEYRQARANRETEFERRTQEINEELNREKEALLDEYGGPFIRQRIRVRGDETLTDSEKEQRLEELKEKEREFKARRDALLDTFNGRYEEAIRERDAIFEPEYEYPKINGKLTIRENAQAINPHWSLSAPEYTVNCQRCGVAYELRERGFDVQAMAAPEGGIGAGGVINSIFRDADSLDIGGSGHENTLRVRDQMYEWGDGARGVIHVMRADGSGHIFNTQIRDGEFWLIDGQMAAAWNDAEKGNGIDGGALEGESVVKVMLYRTDNTRIYDIPPGWIMEAEK